MPKLPRLLESDPHLAAVEAALAREVKPLWSEGEVGVAHVAFTPALEQALVLAKLGKHVERGFEQIADQLDNEKAGIDAVREREGQSGADRISRLLLLANDGAERLYRHSETLVRNHGERVLAIRVDVPAARLAEKLYGAGKLVKVLLVTDRDATARVLLSLA